MIPRFARLTLLWKILLSTSVAITALFALTGWIVLNDATRTTAQSIEDEVKASFQSYQSLWRARAQLLSSVSLVLSTMSDVRSAFSTGDDVTIRDTAGELWSRLSDNDAIFLVTDPRGRVIASLGGEPGDVLPKQLDEVKRAANRFPRQVSGFLARGNHLFQITITPVYIQTSGGTALLNVLVAGYDVNTLTAQRLKDATGGSEFLFQSQGKLIASTLNPRATGQVMAGLSQHLAPRRVNDGFSEYAPLMTPLEDIEGARVGELSILRSFDSAKRRIDGLRRNIVLLWLFSMVAGLALTYLLARRIVGPVRELDRAAAEVSRQNYSYQIPVRGDDELGRLARTFNNMCASIRLAREELILQERISTIGRLSTSIVHDLRNPLAAIYGGAEMLVDSELPHPQVKRLAGNIYRASRRMQELLQELLNVSRGRSAEVELCDLRSVAADACEALAEIARSQSVAIALDLPAGLELPVERNRIERVFVNLIGNALEAMPGGGAIHISAMVIDGAAVVEVRDNGPGIAAEIRGRLFQPFVSAGKKNGLGLGLALARQTVLDHGGDMWIASGAEHGACFRFRLPFEQTQKGRQGSPGGLSAEQ